MPMVMCSDKTEWVEVQENENDTQSDAEKQ